MPINLVNDMADNANDNALRLRAAPKYSITRGEDDALQWDPPIRSRELANALSYCYPLERSLQEMMQRAILDFLDSEGLEGKQTPEGIKTNPKPQVTVQSQKVISTTYDVGRVPSRPAEQATTESRSSQSPEIFDVWDIKTGESVKPKGRKRGLSPTTRQRVAGNRGNACAYHRKAKTQCNPTQCRQNKLYPGAGIESESAKGTDQRKRIRKEESPKKEPPILNGNPATEINHEANPLNPANGPLLLSPNLPKPVKQLENAQKLFGVQDYRRPNSKPSLEEERAPFSITPFSNIYGFLDDSKILDDFDIPTIQLTGNMPGTCPGPQRISEGSKLFPSICHMDINLDFDAAINGQFPNGNNIVLQNDCPSEEERFRTDSFNWIDDLMASDIPSLEFGWPRDDAGTTATLTDISSSPNTLFDWSGNSICSTDIVPVKTLNLNSQYASSTSSYAAPQDFPGISQKLSQISPASYSSSVSPFGAEASRVPLPQNQIFEGASGCPFSAPLDVDWLGHREDLQKSSGEHLADGYKARSLLENPPEIWGFGVSDTKDPNKEEKYPNEDKFIPLVQEAKRKLGEIIRSSEQQPNPASTTPALSSNLARTVSSVEANSPWNEFLGHFEHQSDLESSDSISEIPIPTCSKAMKRYTPCISARIESNRNMVFDSHESGLKPKNLQARTAEGTPFSANLQRAGTERSQAPVTMTPINPGSLENQYDDDTEEHERQHRRGERHERPRCERELGERDGHLRERGKIYEYDHEHRRIRKEKDLSSESDMTFDDEVSTEKPLDDRRSRIIAFGRLQKKSEPPVLPSPAIAPRPDSYFQSSQVANSRATSALRPRCEQPILQPSQSMPSSPNYFHQWKPPGTSSSSLPQQENPSINLAAAALSNEKKNTGEVTDEEVFDRYIQDSFSQDDVPTTALSLPGTATKMAVAGHWAAPSAQSTTSTMRDRRDLLHVPIKASTLSRLNTADAHIVGANSFSRSVEYVSDHELSTNSCDIEVDSSSSVERKLKIAEKFTRALRAGSIPPLDGNVPTSLLGSNLTGDDSQRSDKKLGEERLFVEEGSARQEVSLASLSGGISPRVEEGVISIEDITTLLQGLGMNLTGSVDQMYCPKDQPSLVDIVLLDGARATLPFEADTQPMYQEALEEVLTTSRSRVRLIKTTCNIDVQGVSLEASSDQYTSNTMPTAPKPGSPAKDRLYGPKNALSSSHSDLEYIRSISDRVSVAATTNPNSERLLTMIYHSKISGTIVKRAMIAPANPSELSPHHKSYSLRWLDADWQTIGSMISDLHIPNDSIPCSLDTTKPVDPYEVEFPMGCALLGGPDPHPLDFIRNMRDKLLRVRFRKASGADLVAERQQGIGLRCNLVEVTKAQKHARARNRNKFVVLFERPMDAMKSFWKKMSELKI